MRPKLPFALLAATALAALTLVPATAAGAVVPENDSTATFGTSYYIDCTAPSGGDGISAPWNSLSAIDGHGSFSPGDRVLLRRGTTCKGHVAPTGSGTAADPIVLGSYGSGALPTLQGGGTASGVAVILLKDVHDWTVQDLHITNQGSSARTTSAYRAGVALQNSGSGRLRGLIVQRLRIDHVVSNMNDRHSDSREWGGIVATTYGLRSDGFDGLIIRDNVIDHVGRTGIMVSNHEYPTSSDHAARVTGNRISWARGDSIVLRGSTDARIDANVSANGSDEWPCPNCGKVSPNLANAGIWVASSRAVRIDHNEVYGERALGGDGEAFDSDAQSRDVVIEYNYAHDNQGGGVLFCGSTGAVLRFNVFDNNLKSAIAFIGSLPAKNTSIYNNTIYAARSTKASVVRTFHGHHGSGVRFYNNIVYSYYSGTYAWPTKVWSRNNTYIGVHGPGEPHGPGWSMRNPRLKKPGSGATGLGTVNGYRPVRSGTVGKGVAISKSVTRDFFGKAINPKRPPRGAAG